MNSQHVIDGWIAQLSFDARGRSAERSRRAAPVLVAAAPVDDAVGAVIPEEPSRPRPRRRTGRVWAREGRPGRAIAGPCLGLG
jgi:hypothetical protein